jgi:N-acetylornithine carbamoyltransferase
VLSLTELAPERIEELLDLADRFRDDGIPVARAGKRVAALFLAPSLRTRTSYQLAVEALGAHCVVHHLQDAWKIEFGEGVVMDGAAAEHVRDAIGFLSGVVDCLGVRSFPDLDAAYEEARADAVVRGIRDASGVPVISLESACWHPMQGLADLQVARRRLAGPREEKTVAVTWAYHPRALPMAVPNTAVVAFARAGYRVRLVHPPGFDLDEEVLATARTAAPDRFSVHHDLDEGLTDADVVYAKSWGARSEYGPGADRAARTEHRGWIIDARRQALGAPAAFMHCLPVRRNVVVADDVIDGPHSWVREQSHARLWTQAAVLHEVLR